MKDALKVNANIDHFRIVSIFGTSEADEIYLAADTRLDRRVARNGAPFWAESKSGISSESAGHYHNLRNPKEARND